MSALAIAVERLRTATTKQAAEAARRELAAAIVADDAHNALALKWLGRRRWCGTELEQEDVANEVLLCLAETPQLRLPPLGISLAVHRWPEVRAHLNRWLVDRVAAVHYGDSAGRRFRNAHWRAFSVPMSEAIEQSVNAAQDFASRAIAMLHGCDRVAEPPAEPAPLSCDGCDGSDTDARGRCQRCRLRRRV